MIAEQAEDRSGVLRISWEEFFFKFDALGLTFVYGDDATGYNQILQMEENPSIVSLVYRPANFQN